MAVTFDEARTIVFASFCSPTRDAVALEGHDYGHAWGVFRGQMVEGFGFDPPDGGVPCPVVVSKETGEVIGRADPRYPVYSKDTELPSHHFPPPGTKRVKAKVKTYQPR